MFILTFKEGGLVRPHKKRRRTSEIKSQFAFFFLLIILRKNSPTSPPHLFKDILTGSIIRDIIPANINKC
jgi:hypothetical protein